jgi:hypothetical protein
MEREVLQDRRRQPGVAVISLRRIWLTQQLQASGTSFRHIVPQLGNRLLPDFRPPLLLDVAEMPRSMLVAILWELSRVPDMTPTLALFPAHEPGIARLLALPLSVAVLIADTVPVEILAAWLRAAPQLARRTARTPPAWVGAKPPQIGELPVATLDTLRALAPYGAGAPANITEAAVFAGVSRRQFCYQLAALRAVVGLSSAHRYRPPMLATEIHAALVART